jgi:molybdate transport system substrate-binding protein
MTVVYFAATVSVSGIAESARGEDTVVVFAAASTTNALDEIKAEFTKDSGVTIETNYAASSTLAQQILNGADAHVFISADLKWAEHLASKEQVARQRNLLGNRLVVVVPVDSQLKIARPEDLLDARVEHVALGETESVPAGRYAKQALVKLNLWDRLAAKVVAGEDVRQTLAHVETANAEAGIVYATDAAISKKVKVACEISEKLSDPIRYPVVLLKHAQDHSAAKTFYDYLGGDKAVKIFEKYGFTVLSATKRDTEAAK